MPALSTGSDAFDKLLCRYGKLRGMEFDDVLTGIGPRLRALRRLHGETLAQLSAATGISVSTLSRLESGDRRPTLELLLPLARAHQVPLDELVDAPPTGDPRVHLRPRTAHHGTTVVPLTRRPGGIQAYKLIMPVGFPSGELAQRTHEGYEWLYVLDGSVRLLLGEHDLTLTAGEVVEFDTRTPHAFANAGNHPCELLVLMGRQGQRAHVRARPKSS
jgi:transcriptional regulator with XRE-family HTH domain